MVVRISRNNQQDSPCNRIYYSEFIEGSTCFEGHTAHHQELQTVFAASGYILMW
jgi:hypothetical protein